MDVQYQRYKLNAWDSLTTPSKLFKGGRVYVWSSRVTRNDKNVVHWYVRKKQIGQYPVILT